MSTYLLNITNGVVAFYEKPAGGGTLDLTTGALCVCDQVSNANISASPNTTDVPATFCSPSSTRNVASSFTLNVDGIQDWGRDDGSNSFSEFLYTHDSGQVIAVLLPESGKTVKAVAEVSVAAGDFLGAAGETLTFTGAFPASTLDIYDNAGNVLKNGATGDTTAKIPVTGVPNCGPATPTKGAAGPGDVFPAEATISAEDATNAAKLAGLGYVANPTTAWATGESITIGTGGTAYEFSWDGAKWAAGAAT
jgi:hypothetical protein